MVSFVLSILKIPLEAGFKHLEETVTTPYFIGRRFSRTKFREALQTWADIRDSKQIVKTFWIYQ